MKRVQKVSIALDLLFLAAITAFTVFDFRKGNWWSFAIDVPIMALLAFFTNRNWKKQIAKRDEPEDLNKTKDLKDRWKDDL